MKKLILFVFIAILGIALVGCNKQPIQFEIQFDSNGGSSVESIITDGVSVLTIPENPIKEGYVFDGWYWDDESFLEPFTANSLLDAPLSSDMIVYAKWIEEQSTLMIQLSVIYNLAVEADVFEGTYEEWLETVRGPEGIPGEDGREVSFQVAEGYIQWQYTGEETWVNLIDLISLTGPAGLNGTDGVDGKEVLFQVSGGYIQWQYSGDEVWTNLIDLVTLTGADGLNGTDGVDGKEVLFQVAEGYIQWQYSGDEVWTNLIDLVSLTGADGLNGTDGVDGREVLFQVAEGYIQWKYTGEETWTNLIEVVSLLGDTVEQGLGISTIEINELGELVVTLTDTSVQNLGQILKTYNVIFKDTNGYVLDVQTVIQGMEIIPSNQIREYYTLNGWYTDIDLTNEYDFTIVPTEDITLYAKWDINQYTITFNSFDGTEVLPITQNYDTEVYEPTEPVKEGYTFSGWYIDETLLIPYIFTSMPGMNLELYASWTINQYQVNTYIYDEGIEYLEAYLNPGETIIETTLGGYHVGVLTSEGRVFAWGQNQFGQVGNGTFTYRIYYPVDITNSFNLHEGETIKHIDFGGYYSGAITSENRIFTWGADMNNQLGDGIVGHRSIPTDITPSLGLANNEHINQYYIGNGHSMVITSNNRVITWGSNLYGQLGNGSEETSSLAVDITEYIDLYPGETVVLASLEGYNTIILTSLYRVFIWGDNQHGQIGINNTENQYYPIDITNQIPLDPNEIVIDVLTGGSSGVITSNQRMFTWGYNHYGQLGDGTFDSKLVPQDITSNLNLLPNEKIKEVTFGALHASLLTTNNRVLTWGYNVYKQLGDTTNEESPLPIDVTSYMPLASNELIISIESRTHNTIATTSTGRIIIWGYGSWGQIGNGSTDNSDPILLPFVFLGEYENSYSFDYNETLNIIEPIREGYTFNGWFIDQDLTIPFTLTEMPAEDMSIYSSWTIENYTITYILDGGNNGINPDMYNINTVITLEDPSKTGYIFYGWYDNAEFNGDPITVIENLAVGDLTLYAKFSIAQYTIYFDSNGGTTMTAITQDYGSVVIEPDSPTKEGYIFDGWYIDEELTNAYIFTTMPAESIGLYAKWLPE